METFFFFLLKAAAGTALFYLVYWLFLREETFYRTNRWFLISALVAAILLPLFPVHYTVFVESGSGAAPINLLNGVDRTIHPQNIESTDSSAFYWETAFAYVYLTGTLIFFLRLIGQSAILIQLILKNGVKKYSGVRVVENEKYELPFSFFNIVFINPKFQKQGDLPEILAHEKVHIRENHWFDLLIVELLTVIFWFNPFIWLFERAIKQNHEYLADGGVISGGHKIGRYQAILINQLMGMQIIGITNNLNFAINTNRLKMMTKKRTPKIKQAKLIWSLPVLAMLLFAFAEPGYRVKSGETSLPGNSEKTVKVAGKITDETGKAMPGVSIVLMGTTTGTVSNGKGEFEIEISENQTVVLSFIGKKSIEDTYSEIVSGRREGGVFQREYKMKNEVVIIDAALFDDEPAPPPIPIIRKSNVPVPPPPPPPVKKSGKPVAVIVEDGPGVEQQKKGDNKVETVFFVVEQMPEFRGGKAALGKYIERMQTKLSELEGVKGDAKVSFVIDEDGKVTEVKVVEKENKAAGNGAVKIASQMPDWTPGLQRGKPVPVNYVLTVRFR